MLPILIIFGLPWWAATATLAVKPLGPRSPMRVPLALAKGLGLVTLAVFPVGLLQPWVVQATTFDTGEALLMPLATPGIHAGGLTVRLLFEPLADAGLLGPRRTTMLSNWPVFFLLSIAQSLAVAAAIAARLLRRDTRRRAGSTPRHVDTPIAALLFACTLNAALNITWPWWGS